MSSTSLVKNHILSAQCFSSLTPEVLNTLSSSAQVIRLPQGKTLCRSNIFETHAFIVLSGTIRLLSEHPFHNELFTIGEAKTGDLVGFVSILRQHPSEAAIAKEDSTLLSFPAKLISSLCKDNPDFFKLFADYQSPSEIALITSAKIKKLNPPPQDVKALIIESIAKNLTSSRDDRLLVLSTSLQGLSSYVGENLDQNQLAELSQSSHLPLRFIPFVFDHKLHNTTNVAPNREVKSSLPSKDNSTVFSSAEVWSPSDKLSFAELGIKEAQSRFDLQGFKLIKGKGVVSSNLATLRMLANAYGVPCPVDIIENALEGSVNRSGSVPIQVIGQLAEAMGFQTQLGSVKISKISKLEFPVILKRANYYSLITEVKSGFALLADPAKGWLNLPLDSLQNSEDNSVEVVLVKRLSDTPQKTFGWSWFSPALKKFKWPLLQVLLASLFIQLFQLVNPLLLQQIIDKVINQSNLSALQVLGAALVLAALFQGLLTAVRTWLLIDTTDRMDLLLGSQVIDKLLRLPLRFFENRPVGELSQRLSELANLRSFLTGTAITSSLDLLFAIVYIFIMFIYSPLLAVVALITIPLYVLMIIFIAPLYRSLVRKQAQFSAKTQSHLIETLSGIQTVKAQHFELNSRWKWQERYSGQIQEGFKSVVLGSAAGEFGNFLNQLSSLLIIWVGVYQVVDGKMSLGQLIAFRIIAGYVTGPILRLSSLWQGYQQAEISLERLADIVDQQPETGIDESVQISLPPIAGKIEFENIKFRFSKKSGPYQVDNLNLTVQPGSFVGIVGQSGSGKSTLMKLLPRLYSPNQGRVLIDNYDIAKVSLDSIRQQVGIVPQDCLLFEGTVRDNIAMNNPDASTDEIIRVSKVAEAHDFIMDLPDGYRTMLGERGNGLSGGQRQRIAIARTILQNPNLLILDEATSALDYETEANVCRNLQAELSGKTVFFITHRLSTVRKSDQIILMSNGRIAESGSHEELMKLDGMYSVLYSHQGD